MFTHAVLAAFSFLAPVWIFTSAGVGGGNADPIDRAARGVVAADHPLASEAGAAVLRLGGNAVDAAVATSLALSVVRPDSCGIGGGGFMMIRLIDDPRHGTIETVINYRETCPGSIGPDSYERWGDAEASRFGGRAVAVPGTVAGLLHALERYGTLDRETVFAPAIALAEEGFAADEHHVRAAGNLVDRFNERPDWRERFSFVWTRLMHEGRVGVGDRIHVPGQGRALRLIARDGRAAFYEGPIAEAIIESVGRDGGVITAADLLGYTPREADPLRMPWRGKTLLVMPPPSSGGIAIAQVFALGDRLGLSLPATGWADAESAHLYAEISRHAFADRSRHLADPAFHGVPVAEMLDPALLDRAAGLVDRERAGRAGAFGVAPLPEDGGTSHFCVVDSRGNAVSCTETINLEFGSLVAVDGFGFCLNNEMDDFTTARGEPNAFGLTQSEANLPSPGKRPLSSMSPTIVLDEDGGVLALAGASGGPRIISSTAQVLMRALGGADADEAVHAPRLHHQWSPDTLFYEEWGDLATPGGLLESLSALGHTVRARRDIGAVQLIRRLPDGSWDAASDRRKGGRPARE